MMEFVGTYWWIWLIGMFVCMALVMVNQVKRIKRMHSEFNLENRNIGAGFKKGMLTFVIATLAASGFSILFLIGVVVQIINYAKG